MFQQHQCGTLAGVFPAHPVGRFNQVLQFGRRVVRGDPARLVSQLDRMILFGEESLRRSLREYVVHYQTERNHQGVGNRLLEPLATVSSNDETIHCHERLGGMLNYYYREAA